MIYNISGEQPFQVLSDSFSVSPSESGYNLYLSADGVNYSQFAAVASGVTRQFTGMNNGNYYILSGNTSDVQVNWNRDCRGGGGGAAGVSSLDGQTGALTTKTINGNAILGEGDIEIQTGSSATVIDFDTTSQQDRASLYTALKALYDGGSGDTINKNYIFYKTAGTRQSVRFEYYTFSGDVLTLGTVVAPTDSGASAYEQVLMIESNGLVSISYNAIGGGATVQYLTEDTWTGAYWEIGTELPEGGSWGVSIRRPDYTEIFETYHRQNEVIVMGEGNIGNTGSVEGNLTITDGNEHIMLDGQGNRYVFKMDFSNGVLYFYHSPDQTGNFTYEGAQGKSYTTGSTEGTVHLELAKVLSGNSWIQKDEILFPKTYFIDNMTTEERVALYNYIKYSGPKVSPISKFCRFFSTITEKDGFMGMCEVYFCRFDGSNILSFSGNAISRNSDILFKVKFNITNDGSLSGKTITEYTLTVNS